MENIHGKDACDYSIEAGISHLFEGGKCLDRQKRIAYRGQERKFKSDYVELAYSRLSVRINKVAVAKKKYKFDY